MALANDFRNLLRHLLAFGTHDLGSDILRELDVLLKRAAVLRIVIHSDIHIDDEQLRIDALCHPCGPRNQVLRRRTRADTNRDPLANSNRFSALLLLEIRFEAAIDRTGDLLQCQFAQGQQVSRAEEVPQRTFRAVQGIDVATAHPRLQGFRREIHKNNFTDSLQHPVGNCLAYLDARDALHHRHQAFNVLHIHGRKDIDVCIQQIHDVLVALGMLAALDVGVCKLIDQHYRRLAGEDRVHIHLFEGSAFVLDDTAGNRFQLGCEFRDAFAPVSLDKAEGDVFAAAVATDAFAQHVEGFPHARRIPEKQFKDALLLRRAYFFQPLLGRSRHRQYLSAKTVAVAGSATICHVKRSIDNQILRFAVSAVTVCAIVIVYFRWVHVNPTTVGFTLLLAILAASAAWGLRYAIFMAFLSTAAFNYFFLPPVLRFTIADAQNWVALFTFLITAIIASNLAERARREALQSDQRRREVERLYAFSQQLLVTENIFELLNVIPRYIVESFNVSTAAVFLDSKQETYYFDARSQSLFPAGQLKAINERGEPVLDREHSLCFMPLRMGVRSLGSIALADCDLSRESLEAVGSLTAIAIERAIAFEKLTKAEAAREGDRLRSVLLDSVTHEFRTPLTAIKASAETLLSGVELENRQTRDLLAVINEESDRLNRLVGEASEMAQLDANQLELHLETRSISEVIDAALDKCRPALQRHTVQSDIPQNLPRVRMDGERISEVLVHLLDNAAKYSPAGSVIKITAERRHREVVISVADHGPGIDQLEQDMIFEKFYRGRNQRAVQGTGMGLAIAKAIIELHGGAIGVTSQLGRGSLFYFSLPAA